MNDYRFIVLFCTVAVLVAGTYEFVLLKDLNNGTHKRDIDLCLSKELRFQLNSGKTSINLHLKENPHVRADADMYIVEALPDGTIRAVKEPFTGKVESKYYNDIDNSAVITVRCVKTAKGPCARTLEGSLRIGDKYVYIAPVSDPSNLDGSNMNREYHDTHHVIREEMAHSENIHLTNDTIEPIPALIAASAPVVAKAAAMDAIETAAGMALKKATGQGFKKRGKGLRLPGTAYSYEKAAVAEEEDVKKRVFVNQWISLDNLNVEKSDFDQNTSVYGVELLVAVDPPLWQKFYALANNDKHNAMNRVREYISHVINGVALTFKSIKGRSFSTDITLKAIIVIKKKAYGPYENAKPFIQDGVWSIHSGDYLRAFKDWVVNTSGIPSRSDFDHAMMLTGYRLIGSIGITYGSAVCAKGGVSLVTQAGYFNTMIVASHELAHNLGADHDEVVGCPKGNIMWMDLPGLVDKYSHRAWEFSNCSIDAFQKTLAKKSCVKDEATFDNEEEYDTYNKLYPGQIYGAEEQCKIAFGQDSYICKIPKPDKICVSLWCYNPQNRQCRSQVPADGTQCRSGNKNMLCIDGQCVLEQPVK